MSSVAKGRPPFRADHVGSLLRPAELRQAFRDHRAGERSMTRGSRKSSDRCIRDAVEAAGRGRPEGRNDGEFRRGSYWGRFVERVEVSPSSPRCSIFATITARGRFTAPYAEHKLARTQPIAQDEFDFLRTVTEATPKITLPAPSTMHFYRCTDFADKAAYSDAAAFFDDLANLSRRDRRARPPAAAISSSTKSRSRCCAIPRSAKGRSLGPVARRARRPLHRRHQCGGRGCTTMSSFGVHMCRGNFKGHYLAQGGYESVAERFFSQHARQPLPARIRHRAPATSRRCASSRTRAWCSG